MRSAGQANNTDSIIDLHKLHLTIITENKIIWRGNSSISRQFRILEQTSRRL